MLLLAERWCDFSPRLRVGIWLLMLLLLAIAVACFRPGEQYVSQPVALKAQWRKTLPLRDVSVSTPPEPSKPFSALDFGEAGSQLMSWQPSGKGGELILDADWNAIPSLFTLLAERRQAMRGFSLQPEKQRLRLTLAIEAISDE